MRTVVACASVLVVAAVAATGPARSEEPVKVEVIRDPYNRGCCFSGTNCGKDRFEERVAPPGPLGPALTGAELGTELRKAEAGVDACGRVLNAANGFIMVNLVIHVDGRVTSATVTGRLAGTPLAACAEKTVKSLRFRGNPGLATRYPFVFRAGRIRDCGGGEKKVNAAALQALRAPLAVCGATGSSKVSVRFAVDADDVIQRAEAQRPSGARDLCVERVFACALGSAADDLPARWEVGVERQGSAYATLRPLDPGDQSRQ